MPEYIKHMILNTLQIFYIHNKNNLHHISILYNISIFIFLSLCVSKCVAWKLFHIYFQVWYMVATTASDHIVVWAQSLCTQEAPVDRERVTGPMIHWAAIHMNHQTHGTRRRVLTVPSRVFFIVINSWFHWIVSYYLINWIYYNNFF